MRSRHLILLAVVLPLFHTPVYSQTKSPVLPEGTRAGGMFSPGVIAGDFLYLSGTLGTRRGEGLLTGIEAQTRQTMENLRRVLDAADMDFSRVVRANVFPSDARHFSAMNAGWRVVSSAAPISPKHLWASLDKKITARFLKPLVNPVAQPAEAHDRFRPDFRFRFQLVNRMLVVVRTIVNYHSHDPPLGLVEDYVFVI